jgi:hypothetical protein
MVRTSVLSGITCKSIRVYCAKFLMEPQYYFGFHIPVALMFIYCRCGFIIMAAVMAVVQALNCRGASVFLRVSLNAYHIKRNSNESCRF